MSNALHNPASFRGHLLLAGIGVYLLSGAVVAMAVIFADSFLQRHEHPTQNSPGFINSFTSWDGRWYAQIVNDGYTVQENTWSSTAFFPVYPFLGRSVVALTGLPTELALLIVSQICHLVAFVLLAFYVRQRYTGDPPGKEGRYAPSGFLAAIEQLRTPPHPGSSIRTWGEVCSEPVLVLQRPADSRARLEWTLLAFAFFPPTLFYRMAYTESLFMLCLVAAMYAMEREWPVMAIAPIVGLATGVRLVGVALFAPLALYAWERFRKGRVRAIELVLAPFVGSWGIAAFMAFLKYRFDDPLAFMTAQGAWNQRPAATLPDYATGLFSFEPIWSVFDRESPAHWERYGIQANPLFNIQVLNVVCFLIVAVLVAVGFRRGILNRRETLLAGFLLGIPYFTHSYQTLMWSEARFASVVFPAYLVLGELASRMPIWAACGVLGLSAFFLGAYTALFASWHLVF